MSLRLIGSESLSFALGGTGGRRGVLCVGVIFVMAVAVVAVFDPLAGAGDGDGLFRFAGNIL